MTDWAKTVLKVVIGIPICIAAYLLIMGVVDVGMTIYVGILIFAAIASIVYAILYFVYRAIKWIFFRYRGTDERI